MRTRLQIIVDSNVSIDVVGDGAEHRQRAEALCDRLVHAGERIVASGEGCREILHRYRSIGRDTSIARGFEHLS